jgi:hypothetical protein
MVLFRNPAAAFEYEIAQERASALGRLGRELERALLALQIFDAAHSGSTRATGHDRKRRDHLVAEAGQALWYLIVQRDACGLHGSESLMVDYAVPAEVRNRMGPLQSQAAS